MFMSQMGPNRLLQRIMWFLIPAAILWSAASPAVGDWAIQLTERDDDQATGQEEAIVVLTGSLTRLYTAARLQQQTGLPIAILGNGAEEYIELGGRIDARIAYVEPHSMDTEENAAYGACLLESLGIRRVFVVTEPLHARRAVAWLRYYGIKTTFVGTPGRERIRPASTNWLPSVGGWQRSHLVLHEWGGLLEYAAKRTARVTKTCA